MEGLFDQRRYLIPFRSGLLPQIFTDTLVLGAGVAGLRAGLAAAEHGEVIVLAKGDLRSTNTAWAQGGIAAVLDEADSTASHVADTLAAGAGVCDGPAVRLIVEQAGVRVRELLAWGMRADRDAAGGLSMGREGGHSASRILHANGDETGRELQRTLEAKYRATPGTRLFEQCFALDLITPSREPGSPVLGAITHHPKHGLQMIWARATILASGGAGVLFRETTNPPQATADGLAMAYRAGATLADMAYVQFHPTTLYLAGASRALITEALRGAGAVLLDGAGRRFMPEAHPQGDLAPRDVVSREIVRQIARQGGSHVWLDCRGVAEFDVRFPGIARVLRRFDLRGDRDLIPVHPAAHYMVGGVRTDLHGRTDVPGLYAVGEVACTGLHGANRLASNSLLEGLVMGAIAGHDAGALGGETPNGVHANGHPWSRPAVRPSPTPIVSDIRPSERGELDLADVRSSLRSAMWKNVGIERNGQRLSSVVEMIDFWGRYTLDKIFDDVSGWETQNMLLAAGLVARAAMWREESRGCHARADFPEPRDEFRVHDLWRRGQHGPRTVSVVDDPAGAPA
ncbi:MAG: L-aspartate oxidase [Phycisphaerae bacterium]|nr:MAG: L-aspartate oxidase [Phycisphaerae bacterium]